MRAQKGSGKASKPKPPIDDEESGERTKVVFRFDPSSLDDLIRITEQSQFVTMGEAVRRALGLVRELQEHAKNGFSEVFVRNPKSKEERELLIEFLDVLAPPKHSQPKRNKRS